MINDVVVARVARNVCDDRARSFGWCGVADCGGAPPAFRLSRPPLARSNFGPGRHGLPKSQQSLGGHMSRLPEHVKVGPYTYTVSQDRVISIKILPRKIVVVEYRRDESGKLVAAGDEYATVTNTPEQIRVLLALART